MHERLVARGELDAFAACLAHLDPEITAAKQRITRTATRWAVELAAECATYQLELAARADGGLAIAAITSTSECDESGVVGGVVGGTPGTPPPPPPPPPGPPQNIPPTLLEGSRIAGNKMIAPDDMTRAQIAMTAKDKYIGSFKLCVSTAGDVTSVVKLKSTGLPDYDAKLEREMKLWRYKPFMVNGKSVPVCTAVTFVYSQQPPPPPPPRRTP